MEVALCDYGARVVSIMVPDKSGKLVDVALGFDHIDGYIGAVEPYYGVTVGRFANRLSRGRFSVDGETYQVIPNNGINALHGGANGFHTQVWDRRIYDGSEIHFHHVSPDGAEGFPGNLRVSVVYSLTDNNVLKVSYRAYTDKPTILNLTNHTFFNLNGEGGATVENHYLQLFAHYYLPVDPYQIPTGEMRAVDDTPFNFRKMRDLGEVLFDKYPQIQACGGIDHTFIVNKKEGELFRAAKLFSPRTGILLEVSTTEPGVQVYTGNALSGKDKGKSGQAYKKHAAVCLETQKFPDSPNQAGFSDCILRPEECFTSETTYAFSILKG